MEDIYKIVYSNHCMGDTEYVTIILDDKSELYHIISLSYHRMFSGFDGDDDMAFKTWSDAVIYLNNLKYNNKVSSIDKVVIDLDWIRLVKISE